MKRGQFRWIVAGIIFITSLMAGADRANIGVVVPYIKEQFQMTNTDIGSMMGLFFLAYAICQVPMGLLFEKFGLRVIFSLGIALTSLSTFAVGMANTVLHIKIARWLLGLSESPMILGSVATINRWFPAQERAIATGLMISAYKLAPALTPPLTAYIVLTYGWQQVFFLFAIPGFALSALWFFLVRNNPHESKFCSQAERDYILSVPNADELRRRESSAKKTESLRWLDKLIRRKKIEPLTTNRAVLRSWNVWGCAVGYFFLVGITYTIMTWIPTYLVTVKKYTILKMGFISMAPWLGAIIGNMVGGFLSDKVFDKRRKPMMLWSSFATVGMMLCLLFAPNDTFYLGLILFFVGVMLNLGYSIFLVYPLGLTTKDKSPFTISIVNTAGSLGGAFAPFITGVLLDNFTWSMVFVYLGATSLLTFFVVVTLIEPSDE
jgi:sugar phosphate permease